MTLGLAAVALEELRHRQTLLKLRDGLKCFTATIVQAASHTPIVVGSGRQSVQRAEFRCVNTVISNLKTAISGTYHSFKFDKYIHRDLAEVQYRFNSLYHMTYRKSVFDTHVHQADLHQRLLTHVSDAVQGFMRDMERIGRADDVVLLAFSEFGRRVPENTSLGTGHGAAGPMFIAGKMVKGGPVWAAGDPGRGQRRQPAFAVFA